MDHIRDIFFPSCLQVGKWMVVQGIIAWKFSPEGTGLA